MLGTLCRTQGGVLFFKGIAQSRCHPRDAATLGWLDAVADAGVSSFVTADKGGTELTKNAVAAVLS